MPPSNLPPTGPPPAGLGGVRSSGSARARLLLLLPAVGLAFVVAEMIYLTIANHSPGEPRDEVVSSVLSSIAVLVWNGLPPAALAGLVLLGDRRWPLGLPVVAGTCVLFTAVLVWSLISMNLDDSSTAVLLLLFLPFYLLLALVPFVGLTALVHGLRLRGARRKA